MRRAAILAGLMIVALIAATCVKPQPAPTVRHVTVIADDAPRYVSLPPVLREWDFICLDVNLAGTCASVAEVKQFLLTRRAEP